jgi:phosphoribosylanthranilate isomerase
MSLWVKICANTSLEDARVAVDAGADALGFVFAPSPRRVTPAQASAIVSELPAAIEKMGVFVEAPVAEIFSTVEACGLTGVQLHCGADETLTARVRTRFGPGLRILRVVHFAQDARIPEDPNADGFLVDSRTATAMGGTGVTYDWGLAATTLFQNAKARERLIAAGGLTPENVAEAVARLRPWGVDVVSGVEAAPGRKDAAKVRAFVANARAAHNVTSGRKHPKR